MPKIRVKQVDSYIFRNTESGPLYLMLKRSTGKYYEHLWQGVAGKIEKGETAVQTVIRELKEETGKTPVKIFAADHIASFYDSRNARIQMVPIFGIEVDNSEVQLSEEHSEYKWVSFEEALALLTWKGQKEGLRTVHDEIMSGDDRTKWSEIKL
ncbi:MAG: NUDIX domain-containing protein [Candidatus Marinimicrobia bacterium]|nr:NUDIX domain-containing protein [Candidatus Neomarinimicrobiota bacterium]